MKLSAFLPPALMAMLPIVSAYSCQQSAFDDVLPANATVNYAYHLDDGATFEVPSTDIPYPTCPTGLRALCAIQVTVTAEDSSLFTFGLFLPDDWNSRFLAVGNGGFAGGINWLDMGAGVTSYGFATMSTNTGHSSGTSDITWAVDNEPAKINFGYRAMHGSVEVAKLMLASYYGSAAGHSYYSGCSTGGRQGLKEVEEFPDDFDGALIGAPAWWTTHLQTWTVQLGLYNLNTSEGYIPEDLFTFIGDYVLRVCDGQDGFLDGIISNPETCVIPFAPITCGVLHISGQCLTAAQVETVKNIYSDYTHDGTLIFPGLQHGSEAQWPVLLSAGVPNPLGTEYVQDFLLNDPDWDFTTFNYSIVQLADQLDPGNATASNFDISPFQAKGGKIIHYHGLSDALISTGSSVYFFEQVNSTLDNVSDFYRFFLVPGMQHCAGTPADMNAPWYFGGGNQAAVLGTSISGVPGFRDAKHDALLALVQWAEGGTAPDLIVATKYTNETKVSQAGGTVLRQRPICPFPQQATYVGKGDQDDASSWKCRISSGYSFSAGE